jgi:UDP-N-acetylglucosamine 2-epimerase
MKLASIVGARPEFVQAAAVSSVIRERHNEILIHTGQHYDDLMSDVFFRDLKLPLPDIYLDVGSRLPSEQTGEMLIRLERALSEVDPDVVVVRGDTNSTLAGAIAARQGLFPLAHIESGMRSFDLTMPEEVNRVATDHIADILFAIDADGASQLAAEGVQGRVFVTGDVMYDTYCMATSKLLRLDNGAKSLRTGPYDILTIHRAENTDDPDRLRTLLRAFSHAPRPVIFPIHPRTRKRITEFEIVVPATIQLVEPLGYLDMLKAERGASCIFTDSGGVQREAYFAGIQCVTLRNVTEWTNTVKVGWNSLAGTSLEGLISAFDVVADKNMVRPPLFGDGRASHKIVAALESEPVTQLILNRRQLRKSRHHV